ncbi:DUF1848 domain-containing protein [Clostridium sp. D2Q-11]|uniref:DUF1848 domain-containing protein n=1 Tax=Anaeromonas frigoriresistens TaxID=2683708 RepID=A0A942Z7I1_9FIRM|nr:DUF1848 domain-containing protein [Anaeromonas frigoriresistens]MBS4539586.1 DUF1848 domain-containing protein [Anaeromonas frigoriresistens]
MILSVSRRTDIPAYYTEWFFNRLEAGEVLVRNPMNYHQVSRVKLNPDIIDCIVFWTKDPTNMLEHLDKLKEYNYYFQVTINPYDKTIERNVSKKNDIIDSFQNLSEKIERERVVWRYDPIILTEDIDIDYHEKYFEYLASRLSSYTEKCVFSFIEMYRKTEKNMKNIDLIDIDKEKMLILGEKLYKIADKYNIRLESCSEEVDLCQVGINNARCIDLEIISKIVGQDLDIKKDKNQREICGCVSSIDIGAYNTCKHGCLYCYANFSDKSMKINKLKHDVNSPMLIGNVEEYDKITDRKMESYRMKNVQLSLDII